MTQLETFISFAITILVIFLIFGLIYCKMTGKGIGEFFGEILDIFRQNPVEVIKK